MQQQVRKHVFISVTSLLVSILVGFVLPKTGVEVGVVDQIIFTLCLFLACLVVDILYVMAEINDRQIHQAEVWSLQYKGDAELSVIRRYFHKLVQDSHGKEDRFVAHFMRQFEHLSRSIRDVAEKQELRVVAHHFLNVDNTLEAVGEEKVIRFTWPIEANDRIFSELPWQRVFEGMDQLARKNQLKWIRAILVVEDMKVIQAPRVQKLLDFFHTGPKSMSCRIMLQAQYQAVCQDNNVPPQFKDFGIYGNQLLFASEEYLPETVGTFIKDKTVVNNYVKLFDMMWESSALTRSNPSTTKHPATLEELFSFDEDAS